MNTTMPDKSQVLTDELPPARLREVVEAAGKALLDGEQGARLRAIDPDGSTLETAVTQAVSDALAISPLKALITAWKGMKDLADLIDAKGPEDGKERSVAIATHTLKAQFMPGLVVELNGVADLKKLPIPVIFSLKVDGAIVTVMDRVITSVAAGRAKPTVEVKIEGVTVIKEVLSPFDLPLRFENSFVESALA